MWRGNRDTWAGPICLVESCLVFESVFAFVLSWYVLSCLVIVFVLSWCCLVWSYGILLGLSCVTFPTPLSHWICNCWKLFWGESVFFFCSCLSTFLHIFESSTPCLLRKEESHAKELSDDFEDDIESWFHFGLKLFCCFWLLLSQCWCQWKDSRRKGGHCKSHQTGGGDAYLFEFAIAVFNLIRNAIDISASACSSRFSCWGLNLSFVVSASWNRYLYKNHIFCQSLCCCFVVDMIFLSCTF